MDDGFRSCRDADVVEARGVSRRELGPLRFVGAHGQRRWPRTAAGRLFDELRLQARAGLDRSHRTHARDETGVTTLLSRRVAAHFKAANGRRAMLAAQTAQSWPQQQLAML